MLTKRAHILFDREEWEGLGMVAKEQGCSIGELVREAVRKMYLENAREGRLREACASIRALRPKFKALDYKELIQHGRRI